ncbi:MAG: hypothetical protein CM1200mP30_24710 [Pseudomonadota bacterium]|nr:MAG: hypothetical protein CM1200mP30_24710 [Pseudomonadota bacterium]
MKFFSEQNQLINIRNILLLIFFGKIFFFWQHGCGSSLTRKTIMNVYLFLKKKGKRSEWEMDSAIKLRLMKNVVPQPVIDWIQIRKKIKHSSAKYLPNIETLGRVDGA